MKLVTMEEFLAIEGNVIFAPFYGKHDDGELDMDLGELEVRFEKLNPTNWYSYQIGGDIMGLAGADMGELDVIRDMIDGKGNSIDFDAAGTRQYPACYDENQRFLVMEDKDVETFIYRLLDHFPVQAEKVITALAKNK